MSWVLLSRQSKTSAHQTHAGRESDYQTWPGRARARAAPSSTPSADLLPHSANVTSAFSGAGGLAFRVLREDAWKRDRGTELVLVTVWFPGDEALPPLSWSNELYTDLISGGVTGPGWHAHVQSAACPWG